MVIFCYDLYGMYWYIVNKVCSYFVIMLLSTASHFHKSKQNIYLKQGNQPI